MIVIKAIIFDFGQTLVDSANGFRTAEKEAQAKLFRNLNPAVENDFLDVYRQVRKKFHRQSNFSRKSIWQEVYQCFSSIPDMGLLEKWENQYWDTVKAKTKLFPETARILEALCSRYQIAMITNTQGQTSTGAHRISQFPELEKYFAVIIVAGEGGIPPKPHPAPFEMCLKKLGVSPFEALYVGDDYRIDIRGARDSGLHAVWLKHHSVQRTWPQVKTSVPVIARLDELLELEKLLS